MEVRIWDVVRDYTCIFEKGCICRYVGAMVLGTTLGRPQTNAWTLGRVHNIINKGDGRFLAKIHVAVDGEERYAGQIKSPPEFSVLTYDNTSRYLLCCRMQRAASQSNLSMDNCSLSLVQLAKDGASKMSVLAEPPRRHDVGAHPLNAFRWIWTLAWTMLGNPDDIHGLQTFLELIYDLQFRDEIL